MLAELDYLISSHAGQGEATKLLRDVARGVYDLESISATDVAEALRVVERYADLRVGLADASIVVLADRFGCCDILTLDQRHFRVISGSSGKAVSAAAARRGELNSGLDCVRFGRDCRCASRATAISAARTEIMRR